MFGVDMRLPIETELAEIMPMHQRNTSSANDIAKQLALMRQANKIDKQITNVITKH